MPKRKQKQDLEKDDLLSWASALTQFKVNGKLLPRKTFQGPERCPGCGVKERQLHKIPCKEEESPCGIHETCWECDCLITKEDES